MTGPLNALFACLAVLNVVNLSGVQNYFGLSVAYNSILEIETISIGKKNLKNNSCFDPFTYDQSMKSFPKV